VVCHDGLDAADGGWGGARPARWPIIIAQEGPDDRHAGADQRPAARGRRDAHRVFGIVDGADDDWASWYAQWLIDLSELPDLLGARPVRSELIYLLVSLDKQYTAEAPGESWEVYYTRGILRHFRPSGS
jgi:hypothetical protein